jgi:hypothetical protein
VRIDADDAAGRADARGGAPGNNPGATGDIEDPLSGLGGGAPEEILRPWSGQSWDEEQLVDLGRVGWVMVAPFWHTASFLDETTVQTFARLHPAPLSVGAVGGALAAAEHP